MIDLIFGLAIGVMVGVPVGTSVMSTGMGVVIVVYALWFHTLLKG